MTESRLTQKLLRWFAGANLAFFLINEVAGLAQLWHQTHEVTTSPLFEAIDKIFGILWFVFVPVLFLTAYFYRRKHRHILHAVVWAQLLGFAFMMFVMGSISSDFGLRELVSLLNYTPLLFYRSPTYFYSVLYCTLLSSAVQLALIWAFYRFPPEFSSFRGPWLTWGAARGCAFGFVRHGVAAAVFVSLLTVGILRLVVEGGTSGALVLGAKGVYSRVDTYRKDSHSVVVYPMVHIGDREFYHRLSSRFGEQEGVMLMEGVRGGGKKLKKLDHRDLASLVGVSSQSDEMLKNCKPENKSESSFRCAGEKLRYVDADVDYSEISGYTRNYLEGIGTEGVFSAMMKEMENGGTLDLATLDYDIEDRRENRLFREFAAHKVDEPLIVIPWGAAHAPHITQRLEGQGYVRQASELVRVLSFSSILRRILGAGPKKVPHKA